MKTAADLPHSLSQHVLVYQRHGEFCKEQAYLAFKKIFIYFNFIIYLPALGLSCSMWGLIPRPGIKPESPALGAQS